jgi:hypothetical protein
MTQLLISFGTQGWQAFIANTTTGDVFAGADATEQAGNVARLARVMSGDEDWVAVLDIFASTAGAGGAGNPGGLALENLVMDSFFAPTNQLLYEGEVVYTTSEPDITLLEELETAGSRLIAFLADL